MTLRVAILTDFFPPAERGGSVRALSEYLTALTRHCDVRVITRDRDPLSGEIHGVDVDRWVSYDGARVLYATPPQLSARLLLRRLHEAEPDVVYLNSLFSTLTQRVLWARRFGGLPSLPVVLAPEGELSPGALQQKRAKKVAYLALARGVSLYRDITWKVATAVEADEVRAVIGAGRIRVAGNVARLPAPGRPRAAPKRQGHARLLFLSRLTPKKNLPFLLERLARVGGDVHLDIVGPVEDDRHWRRCQALMRALPARMTVRYRGACHPHDVWRFYAENHALVLPTLGENFGYVVQESLAAGCPVIISDRTPWTDIEAHGSGWAIPLDDESRWVAALSACVEMGAEAHGAMSDRARTYLGAHPHVAASASGLVEMLSKAAGRRRPAAGGADR